MTECGSRLIDRIVAPYLDTTVKLKFDPEEVSFNLTVTIDLPEARPTQQQSRRNT